MEYFNVAFDSSIFCVFCLGLLKNINLYTSFFICLYKKLYNITDETTMHSTGKFLPYAYIYG